MADTDHYKETTKICSYKSELNKGSTKIMQRKYSDKRYNIEKQKNYRIFICKIKRNYSGKRNDNTNKKMS